jgi:hypothetical protein
MVGETGFEPATLWSQTRCAMYERTGLTLDITMIFYNLYPSKLLVAHLISR